MTNNEEQVIAGVEDLKNKLKSLEEDNQKINEELFALRNKFYVQTKILNDKNAELSKEVSEKEQIKNDRQKIMADSEVLQKKYSEISKEKEQLLLLSNKNEEKFREMCSKYNDSNLKYNYLIAQLESKNSELAKENSSLKESSSQLQLQLTNLDKTFKQKESKLTFDLESKSKEINSKLKQEILSLQQKNELLLDESIQLKKERNEILNELQRFVGGSNANEMINQNSNIPNHIGGSENLSTNSTSIIVGNVGNYLDSTKEELMRSKEKIKEYENKERDSDRIIKALRLDLNQSEKDAKSYFTDLQQKSEDNQKLNQKIIALQEELKTRANAEELNIELQEKNQTITFLLNQIENFKREKKVTSDELSSTKTSMQAEKDNLHKQLQESQNMINDLTQNFQSQINDLKQENLGLINDLNSKDSEYKQLLENKIKFENNCNTQFSLQEQQFNEIQRNLEDLNNENSQLKNQIIECTNLTGEKFKEINEEVITANKNMESIEETHKMHLKYLNQRFDYILHELDILFSIQKNNPVDLNEKFSNVIKTIKSSIDLIEKISEREAQIDTFRKQVSSLKNSLNNSKSLIKELKAENSELNQTLNKQKLRMKIKENNKGKDNQAENAYDKLTRTLKEYFIKTKNNVDFNSLLSENRSLVSKLELGKEKQGNLQKSLDDSTKKVAALQKQLDEAQQNFSKENKSNRKQMKSMMEQLENIKETWVPYEKKEEYVKYIGELEKDIKDLKEDINRKKEYISQLKESNEKKEKELNEIKEENAGVRNNEEAIKGLKAEIGRKELTTKRRKNHSKS